MTISNTNIISPLYLGNGRSRTFFTKFFVGKSDYVKVIVREQGSDIETELVEGTDYVVRDVGKGKGASIVLTDPLPTGTVLRALLNVPVTQEVSYITEPEPKHIPVSKMELSFDKLMQINQTIDSNIKLHFNKPTELGGMALPEGGIDKAGFLIRYDFTNGLTLETVDPTEVFPPVEISAVGEAFMAANNASEGRSAIGLGSLATQSGTFSGTSSGTNTGDQNVFSRILVPGHEPITTSPNTTVNFTASGGVDLSLDGKKITVTPPDLGYVSYVGVNYRKNRSTTDQSAGGEPIPGMQHTVTPPAIGTRYLIIAYLPYTMALGSNNVGFTLYKNGAPISGAIGDAEGSRRQVSNAGYGRLYMGSSPGPYPDTLSTIYVDTVDSTSSTTYQMYLRGSSSSPVQSPASQNINNSPVTGVGIGSFIVLEI